MILITEKCHVALLACAHWRYNCMRTPFASCIIEIRFFFNFCFSFFRILICFLWFVICAGMCTLHTHTHHTQRWHSTCAQHVHTADQHFFLFFDLFAHFVDSSHQLDLWNAHLHTPRTPSTDHRILNIGEHRHRHIIKLFTDLLLPPFTRKLFRINSEEIIYVYSIGFDNDMYWQAIESNSLK